MGYGTDWGRGQGSGGAGGWGDERVMLLAARYGYLGYGVGGTAILSCCFGIHANLNWGHPITGGQG